MFHGAIGLPCQRCRRRHLVAAHHQRRRTDGRARAHRAAGSATQCGPRVAPASSTTVSIRMIRSWNRWVCTTQPRLTVRPRPSVTRSASGSQYVSHQTPRPIVGAERPQPQVHHRRPRWPHGRTTARRPSRRTCRRPRCATRTTTTADARSPGSGRPEAISPRRDDRPRPRPRPAGRPAAAAPAHQSRIRIASACRTASTADADRERHASSVRGGTVRPPHRDQPSAASAGRRCAARRPRRAAPQPDRRTAQPRRARLALGGVADSTATSPSSGTRAARAGSMPELPRNARLPIGGVVDAIQPARQLVGRDHRVVGEEGAVVDDGESRQSAAPSRSRCPCRPWRRAAAATTGSAGSRRAGTGKLRAASIRRSVVHSCQPTRLRTG